MGICSSRPPPRDYEPELEPAQAPESPTWKLPVFPAPALPPLTRQNKIIVASSRYCEDEEEKTKTKKCVLNGMGEALSIVFDAGDLLEEFIPEVKKLFNLAMTITSIELHTAQLDVEADFLQSFLDTLPSHGELRAFSLVVARETPLVFASVSGLLYRNPGLQALRLWGVDLTPAGSGNQFYPACKLLRVDIAHCTMFPQQLDNLLGASKESLLCLRIDRPVGLSGSAIARAVNYFGRKVQMPTILLPEESESEMDMKASYLVGDTASRFPTSLKYLHLGGLAASDNLFTVTPAKPDPSAVASTKGARKDGSSSTAPLQSHLHHLVALRLDNCPRLSVNGLFAAVRQKSMPSLLRLHVYWLENDEMLSDVELWKSFAASEDISVDVETERLVWLTAMKDVPSGAAAVEAREAKEQTSRHGSKQKHKHVQLPQQAHLPAQQQLTQARYLAPPGSYPPAGMPVAAGQGVLPMASMASSYPGMAVLNNRYAAGVSQGLQPGAHSHGSTNSASSRSKHGHASSSRSRGYRSQHRKRRSAESSDSATEISDPDSGASSSSSEEESDSQETAYHSSRSRSRRARSPAGGRSRSSSKSRDRRRH